METVPLPERVRGDVARVAGAARSVQILDEGIEAFADLLMADLHVADLHVADLHVADLHVAEPPTDDAGEGAPDPWSAVAAGDDPERTAGLVLALAAVNFGLSSCFRGSSGC